MKKILIILMFSISFIGYSQKPEEQEKDVNNNIVYGEFSTWIIWNVASVNYEYCFVNNFNRIYAVRAGMGKYFGWEGQGTALPLSFNAAFGKKKLKFECNAGVTLLYKKGQYDDYINDYAETGIRGTIFSPLWALPIAGIGMRYQYKRSVFKGRIAVNGLSIAYGYALK